MWPPPLLDDRPKGVQVVLAFVLPALFGAICGYLLGHSETGYVVLTTVAILGGVNAGFEHVGAAEGVRRGFVGSALFAGLIVIVHLAEGSDTVANLPAPLGVMALIYIAVGAALGALGGWLRERRENRPAVAA